MPRPKADPASTRYAGPIGGTLKDGTAINAAATHTEAIVTAGLARFRIRARVSVAATLRVRFVRHEAAQYSADDEYDTNQPADVALAAGVENKLDVDPHMGEGVANVSIIAGGAGGVIDYVDFCPI